MVGPFDPGIIDNLLRVLHSSGAKYAGNQLGRTFGTQGAGPLRLGNYGGNGGPSGASGMNQFGSNIGNLLGSLGSGASANQQQQPVDPLMALYNQLVSQLQQPVAMPKGIDTADLMNQVKAAINPIYDQRASAAKNTTQHGTQEVGNMYKALSNDYKELAPVQKKQAKEAQAEVEQLYGQLRSNIQGDYSRVSKEQGDMFKQLGIQDALPSVLDKQDDSVTQALTAADENQAQQAQRYQDQGNIDQTYYQEGAPQAIATGNEISTDMIAKLQEQLAQIEAERTAGIQSGYQTELGQAQTQLGQQQQNAQSEGARRQEMLWQMLQGQLNQKSQPLTTDSFMQGLPQNVQGSVADAFTQLERSPEAVYGKTQDPRSPVPGTFVETTPEWYMAQADKMYQEGSIDAATHQALLMYLQLNFKSGQ